MQEFYKDSHMHIKATDNNSGWLFGELLGSCVGLVSQQRWRRVRQPFECHFTRSASTRRSKSFIKEADEFLSTLNSSKNECIINTTNDLKYCPFFMVASIFFGDLNTKQRNTLYKLGPLREELFRETFMGGVNRYAIAKYLPGSAMPRLYNFQRSWEAFARSSCDEAKQKGNAVIVSLWESMEKGDMSMQEVCATRIAKIVSQLIIISYSKLSTNHYSQIWMLQPTLCRGMLSRLLSILISSKSCDWKLRCIEQLKTLMRIIFAEKIHCWPRVSLKHHDSIRFYVSAFTTTDSLAQSSRGLISKFSILKP